MIADLWENSPPTFFCIFYTFFNGTSFIFITKTKNKKLLYIKNIKKGRGGSGWGTHVNPWLIHVNVWQKPLQYCKVISLQLTKINGKKIIKTLKKRQRNFHGGSVVKTAHFYCLGCRIDPWSGNQDPTCHVVHPIKKGERDPLEGSKC